MDNITNYDRWKFRRCIETIRKNQCPADCDMCKFDVEMSKHIDIASEECDDMTRTKQMDDEYAKAVEWHERMYYDDIRLYKIELRGECVEKLAQIREDIENGWVR